MLIKRVRVKRIFDSRGKETIKVDINGYNASSPSGTSKGKYEVKELSKPVKEIIRESNEYLNKKLNGAEFNSLRDLRYIEEIIPVKKFGGNLLIALEFALLKAVSDNRIWKFLNPKARRLPYLLGNCIGGGVHLKQSRLDIQELLLLPKTKVVREGDYVNRYLYYEIGRRLKTRRKTSEHAWSPKLSNVEALNFLRKLVDEICSNLDFKVELGADVAATQLYKNKYYHYKNFSTAEIDAKLTKESQLEFINNLIKDYDLRYVEDPFYEEDFESFSKLDKNILICGDDLICTRLTRLREAIKRRSVNSLIIKPNQVGSLVELFEVVRLAKQKNITPVISHRSGETNDFSIADLSVGLGIPIIKCGILGKERRAKINRLVSIEKEIRGE